MSVFKKLGGYVKDQKKRKQALIGVFVVLFGVVGSIIILRSFAAAPEMYLTPATNNVQSGNDVVVTIRVNAGTAINAVDSTISFDKTKLQFKSIDASASGLPMELISNGDNNAGTVNIVRGIAAGSVTGDIELAKVTFTAVSTTSTTANLSLAGYAANAGDQITLALTGATVNIVGVTSNQSATYTIEPTAAAPVVGTQFGLRVYVTSAATYKGGEVIVNLPTGLTYSGTLDTAGTAFNPATTVTGTTAQSVHLVFVTQSTTLTGKQLVATIPVTSSTAGAKTINFASPQVADSNNAAMTNITANPVSVTVNAASLPSPTVNLTGSSAVTNNMLVTNLKQSFTISNLDSGATYTATLGGQNLPVTNGVFSIPASMKNGDLPLQISVTKNGASGNSSTTIRLRSANVNRTGCVDLQDLLLVNDGYGKPSTDLDLTGDGTVSLVDLLTVTGKWGTECM